MAIPTMYANQDMAGARQGSIRWDGFNIKYGGTEYGIAGGATTQRWTWWRWQQNVIEAGNDVPGTAATNGIAPNPFFMNLKADDLLMAAGWKMGGWAGAGTQTDKTRMKSATGSPLGNGRCLQMTTGSGTTAADSASVSTIDPIAVTPGETLYLRATVRAGTVATSGVYVRYNTGAGTGEVTMGSSLENLSLAANESKTIVSSFVIGSGVTTIYPVGLHYAPNAGANKTAYLDDYEIARTPIQPPLTEDDLLLFANRNGIPLRIQSAEVLDGDLIIDGTVAATALSADAIDGKVITGALFRTRAMGNTRVELSNRIGNQRGDLRFYSGFDAEDGKEGYIVGTDGAKLELGAPTYYGSPQAKIALTSEVTAGPNLGLIRQAITYDTGPGGQHVFTGGNLSWKNVGSGGTGVVFTGEGDIGIGGQLKSYKAAMCFMSNRSATSYSAATDIPFSTRVLDPWNNWGKNVANRFTIPVAGVYRVTFVTKWNNTATARPGRIMVNGANRLYSIAPQAIAYGGIYLSGVLSLSAGDTVSAQVDVAMTTQSDGTTVDNNYLFIEILPTT